MGWSGWFSPTTVRLGKQSGHVVIKTKHRTATPRLSTEFMKFKRNERVYIPSYNQQRTLKTTVTPAHYKSQNRTDVEERTFTT